jgi:hypothetical protein
MARVALETVTDFNSDFTRYPKILHLKRDFVFVERLVRPQGWFINLNYVEAGFGQYSGHDLCIIQETLTCVVTLFSDLGTNKRSVSMMFDSLNADTLQDFVSEALCHE